MIKKKITSEISSIDIRREVAAAVAATVAEAAVAAAKVLSESSLERRVTSIEGQLVTLQEEIKRGNDVVDVIQEVQSKNVIVIAEILEIVKLSKGMGRLFAWIASIGSGIATMAIAWHWYK